jgi:hypothetical protein
VKRNTHPSDPREDAVQEALALWAESARARGAEADTGRLARAVAARVAAGPGGRPDQRAPFGYAAAAAALLAVGLVGAWLSEPERAAPATVHGSPDLEQGSLAVIRLIELEQIPVGR